MKGINTLLSEWEIELTWSIPLSIFPDSSLIYVNHEKKRAHIRINSRLDLKERVVTFFHEVLYLDEERSRKREEKIDNEACSIYNSQPRLVEYVISRYQLDGRH